MNAKTVFLMILLASPICRAYDPNYCPFETGQRPATAATVCEPAYEQQSADGKASLFAIAPGIILVVQKADAKGGLIASLLGKGKVVAGPAALDGCSRVGLRVWAANLTAKTGTARDVIIAAPSGGNGLAACVDCVCFFLRSKTGYTTVSGETYHLDANDFVDLNKDGQAEWIQTEFIRGCPGRDGKAHNYWVLNLIQFRDGRATLANGIDKRFPSWIWFTNKPNHKNTVQLTDAQKQKLFREQAQGLEIYSSSRLAAAKATAAAQTDAPKTR
ncbi:MAG TPA: hypothetical protein PKH24_12175 [Sedimentisphaerales bacterium]|jgi:hypothetical protein|nr:hypothetical protein [Sedimentisphaerales bacterium]HNU31807.1 hypothetical protein [Sedimentisphaerales bacterium]